MIRILMGDCRAVLDTLPEQSIQCCVTSPPYYGLRDYGLPPVVWGGASDCAHQWRPRRYYFHSGGAGQRSADAFSRAGDPNAERLKQARWREDSSCERCGAWLGSLGLQPTV